MNPTANFSVGAVPVPSLKSVKKPFSCAKPNVKNEPACVLVSIVLAHEHHGRPATLIQAPRAADLDVIQELDVEGRQRKVAAEPAVDAGPEPEVLKQLARLEMGADERLFRVDRHAALESDALRVGAAVYQKKDSEHWQP